jgi:hypothetical protein
VVSSRSSFVSQFGVRIIIIMGVFTVFFNKQNFIYRKGCAKEISKKIKDRKNKK